MPPKSAVKKPSKTISKKSAATVSAIETKSLGKSSKHFDERDWYKHIMESSDMFIGSKIPHDVEEIIYDLETKRMKKVVMNLPDGVKRIFLEILTNAGDNACYNLKQGIDPGPIIFDILEDGYLSIKNGGLPIPVEPHKTSTRDKLLLVPEKTFGTLLNGSNYNDNEVTEGIERWGCGRNGLGSKLTNIFSVHFLAEVSDTGRLDDEGNPITGQFWRGEWRDNMKTLVKSEAKPGYVQDGGDYADNDFGWRRKTSNANTRDPYVKVEWCTDFEKFGISGYTDNDIGLFIRYAIEISLSCQVVILINGEKFDYRNIRDFASLFWPVEVVKSAVTQYCWPDSVEVPKEFLDASIARREKLAVDPKYSVQIETQVMILDTPDDALVISFANGMNTLEGGVHVNEVYKKICPRIIGDSAKEKKKRKEEAADKRKGKVKGLYDTKPDKPEVPIPKLTPGDVKPHISLIVVTRIPNPVWNGQSKTQIRAPVPNISFGENVYERMMDKTRWHLMERLMSQLGNKIIKGLAKSENAEDRDFGDKGEDANDATSKDFEKRMKCTLYLVEGKSASSYPLKRIQFMPGKKDRNGYYCLQGKPMNVMASSLVEVAAYKEYIKLKAIIGLKHTEDYKTKESRKNLHYGNIIVTCDADVDGSHILCIVLAWIYRGWPALLEQGYIKYLVTPIIRAIPKDGEVLRFYDEAAYLKWSQTPEGKSKKYEIQYYKGLGKSEDFEIEDDIETAPIVTCEYDENAAENLELAFNPKKADQRKVWIGNWRKIRDTAPVFRPKSVNVTRPISDIINYSLTPYTIENLFRSIPSYKDQIKQSQRKVIYHMLNHWNFKTATAAKKQQKVATHGTAAADKTHYHHGDKSIHDTVMHLAQDYIGTNNLTVYEPKGQFGTRDVGGKNKAQPRYPEVKPAWWIPYVYQKEMVDLVELRKVDGEDAEPTWLPCDVPIGIINGSKGLATGWSTNIPSHHPVDVVDWILDVLKETPEGPTPLMPYFNGFRGSVEIRTNDVSGGNSNGKSASSGMSASKAAETEVLYDEDGNEIDPEYIEGLDDEDDETEESQILQKSQRAKGRCVVTTGVFNIVNEDEKEGTVDLFITEIPVGKYHLRFINWAKKLKKAGKIRSTKDTGNPVYPNLYMEGVPKEMATHAKLGLIKSHGMANLVLIDDDGIPQPYKSVEHIMSKYIDDMLEMYEKLKTFRLAKYAEAVQKLEDIMAIVDAINDGKVVIVGRKKKADVMEKMKTLGLNVEVFKDMSLTSILDTDIDDVLKKIENLENEHDLLAKKPSHHLWIERLTEFRVQLVKNYFKQLVPEKAEIVEVDGKESGGVQQIYHSAFLQCPWQEPPKAKRNGKATSKASAKSGSKRGVKTIDDDELDERQ